MHVCSVLRMVYIQLAVFLLESKLTFTACSNESKTQSFFSTLVHTHLATHIRL